MPALGCRHPEPQAGQSCSLPDYAHLRFCTGSGVLQDLLCSDYLGAYLVSLHAAIFTALQTGSGQKRSPCATRIRTCFHRTEF